MRLPFFFKLVLIGLAVSVFGTMAISLSHVLFGLLVATAVLGVLTAVGIAIAKLVFFCLHSVNGLKPPPIPSVRPAPPNAPPSPLPPSPSPVREGAYHQESPMGRLHQRCNWRTARAGGPCKRSGWKTALLLSGLVIVILLAIQSMRESSRVSSDMPISRQVKDNARRIRSEIVAFHKNHRKPATPRTPPPPPPPRQELVVPDEPRVDPAPVARKSDRAGAPIQLTVTGIGETHADAEEVAFEHAQQELAAYLRDQYPPIEWEPPANYVKQVVKVNEEVPTNDYEAEKGMTHKVRVVLEITPEERVRIDQWDREYRQEQRAEVLQDRMGLLARIVGGLVVLLATIAGYIRLDDLTKGYYSGWLRLAAAGIILAVGAALWAVTF